VRASETARSVLARLRPAAAPDAVLQQELTQARTRLRRTRAQLRQARRKAAGLERELKLTRASLRSPVHDLVLPDRVAEVIERVSAEKLTYLSRENLATLATLVLDVERRGLPGAVVEAGTARGGSAIVMAAAKSPDRPMQVYDVFGMIPPPTDADGADVHERYERIVAGESRGVGAETYYGYRDNLYDEVTDSFERLGVPVAKHGVELVQGLFADTVHPAGPVALAHLDGDWYESTLTCLERIAPALVPGGRIVLDDYWAWSGCRRAVDEYFADRPGYVVERRAKVHVVRV
jgi:asparagine synthase (glutamine-hydrolysing)